MWNLIHKKKLRRKIKNATLTAVTKHDDVSAIIGDLRVAQLRGLLMSIRTRGGICSCLHRTARNKSTSTSAVVAGDWEADKLVMCRAFRWPALERNARLLKIPNCVEENCINPFHYSVWQDEEEESAAAAAASQSDCDVTTAAPLQQQQTKSANQQRASYKLQSVMTSASSEERHNHHRHHHRQRQPASGIKKFWKRFCIGDDSEPESSSPAPAEVTSSPPAQQQQQLPVWCKLVYWEGRKRVGRQFPVSSRHINIFNSLPRGDGFCLAALDSPLGGVFDDEHTVTGGGGRAPGSSPSARIRTRIGHGITIELRRGGGDVIMHNRSEHPVFVHSPALLGPAVRKLASGSCMRIFRFRKRSCAPPEVTTGEMTSSVRVSFVKGWGSPEYKRTCLLTCPCWLEIYCRKDFRYT